MDAAAALLQATPLSALDAFTRPCAVVCPDTSLASALAALKLHGVLSLPVIKPAVDYGGNESDDFGNFVGVVDGSLICRHLLGALAGAEAPSGLRHDGVAPSPLLADVAWRPEERALAAQCITHAANAALAASVASLALQGDGSMVYKGGESSLFHLIHGAFISPAAVPRSHLVQHRVVAANISPELSSSALLWLEVSGTSVISQFDIIRFLRSHLAELGPFGDAPISTRFSRSSHSALFSPDLFTFCIPADCSGMRALVELDERGLSAAGVVDSRGSLVASFSIADLRSIPADAMGLLALGVLDLLCVLQGGRSPPTPATVQPTSRVRDVIESMVDFHVHHVWVIDDARTPMAVVTPTDVLALLVTGGCIAGPAEA